MGKQPTTVNLARDERLATLLAELGDQARRGGRPNVEAAAAAHPDLAEELRQLWAAGLFADEFARPLSCPDPPPAVSPASGPMPPSSALPRTFGDYELREELGRGGMGVVYKAWQRGLRRTVALKMILRRRTGDARRSGRASRPRLRLPLTSIIRNIVPVYDSGEVDGQPFFSMRYVEGQTLAQQLKNGPMRPLDAVRTLAPICRAVAYAHHRGILHRDLKPSNILIGRDGRPQVTDFGLAKRVAQAGDGSPRLTLSGALVGTASYMAPEQASGRPGAAPVPPATSTAWAPFSTRRSRAVRRSRPPPRSTPCCWCSIRSRYGPGCSIPRSIPIWS